MAIAYTVEKFLQTHGIPFDVLKHPHTVTSLECAEAAHLQGDRLAKAVLLEDPEVRISNSKQKIITRPKLTPWRYHQGARHDC